VPLAPALAPITPPTPTFASMAPPAPVQRSRRRSRSRQRSPRADAHVPRSRRRPIASLAAVMAAAAAGGGMHGYLQGRDAIEQASVSKARTFEAAWRIPLTWHTSRVKAEPQGAGSANVYSLRRSSGVGTVLICRRHQQWGGARIAAHPRREANGGGRPRRARARSGSHRRQRLLRHHSAHRAWTGPTLRIRGPSCVYAAHRAFTRPIVRKSRGVRECAPRCVYARKCVYANAGCVYVVARAVGAHGERMRRSRACLNPKNTPTVRY